MNISMLTPVEDYRIHFFDDPNFNPPMPASNLCKIYHDGGHYVATLYKRSSVSVNRKKYVKKDIDILFDGLFKQAMQAGLRDKKHDRSMTEYIKAGLSKLFADMPNMDEYIKKGIKRRLNNILHRKKRFRRKGFLNRWNYFVTLTYFYGHF